MKKKMGVSMLGESLYTRMHTTLCIDRLAEAGRANRWCIFFSQTCGRSSLTVVACGGDFEK